MKLLEVVADSGHVDTVAGVAEKYQATDFRPGHIGDDGRQTMRLLVTDDRVQAMLDALQSLLGTQPDTYIIVLPVDIVLPKATEPEQKEEDSAMATREALYASVQKGARLDANFLALVALSTIVAVMGLVEDNVAIVIGAMVIAPLLGPNLALALGTALGDLTLMRQSLLTSFVGLTLALLMSVIIGRLMPLDLTSHELIARTDVGMDSVALALASGAAATLSLTTGLSSVLVGVMVAVALLPPAATLGLMLGSGHGGLATGAALLLAVNIVSVNLAAKVVFLIKGVRPRTWLEKDKARRAMTAYIVVWLLTLLVLLVVIYSRIIALNNT